MYIYTYICVYIYNLMYGCIYIYTCDSIPAGAAQRDPTPPRQ